MGREFGVSTTWGSIPGWIIALALVIFVSLLTISFFTGRQLEWSPLGWISKVPHPFPGPNPELALELRLTKEQLTVVCQMQASSLLDDAGNFRQQMSAACGPRK